MPPQQSDRLLDLFDDALDFRAHADLLTLFASLVLSHHQPFSSRAGGSGIRIRGCNPKLPVRQLALPHGPLITDANRSAAAAPETRR
jgi:hypothetical protein